MIARICGLRGCGSIRSILEVGVPCPLKKSLLLHWKLVLNAFLGHNTKVYCCFFSVTRRHAHQRCVRAENSLNRKGREPIHA